MHPIVYLMIATFGAVVMVLFLGIATMGRQDKEQGTKSSKLMMLRIALSFFLLAQIIYYVLVIKGA